jgi:hypothetical protein
VIDGVFTVTGYTIAPSSPIDGLTLHESSPTKLNPHKSSSSSATHCLRHGGPASAPQPDPTLQSSSSELPPQPTMHTRQPMCFPPHTDSKSCTSPSLEAREARDHEPTWRRNPIAGEHSDDSDSDEDLDPESQAIIAHFHLTGRLLHISDRPKPPPGMEAVT